MNEISLKARAKINLNLDIIGRRDDGYHLLEMIMQQIDLYDVIKLKKINRGISLTTNCSSIKADESNTAYKAAFEMMALYNKIKGVHIDIEKNIPVAAGLAGGSADAAGVLTGLNELYDLNLSLRELMDIGLKIGADVPFCILGGCAIAKGIGEKLEPIVGLLDKWILLSTPPISVSTKDVYSSFELKNIRKERKFDDLVDALEKQNLNEIGNLMYNSLEEVTTRKYCLIKELKDKIIGFESKFAMMSGSGPTVFGVYEDYEKAYKSYEEIIKIYEQTYLVRTHSSKN